jgi:LysR family glycine cleavage system transcriptional activator
VVGALVALGGDDRASARLVAPFALRVATRGAYYLAWRADAPQLERVKAFEAWVVQEAEAVAGKPER